MKCEHCDNMVVDDATQCPWCGAELTKTERKKTGKESEYSVLLQKERLLRDEAEVQRLELVQGTLLLTTKKVRANVTASDRRYKFRQAKGVKTIDALLTSITGYSIINVKAPRWLFWLLVLFAVGAVICCLVGQMGVGIVSIICMALVGIIISLCRESLFRIAIPGDSIEVRIGPFECGKAQSFVEALRKAKADYELRIGV